MRLKPRVTGRGVLKFVRNVAILGVVYLVGVNVGDGTIDLTPASTEVGNLPKSLDYSEANQVYRSLLENYDGKLSEQQLEDGLKHGLATATKDPYTTYFTAKEASDFESQLNNSFSGIGAQLGQDKDGNLEVIAPIDGLPADKAGIKAKDIIATINKESTSGMSVDEAVSKIRGKAGTQVKLQIVRNRAQALEFSITRADIHLPSVKTKTLDGNVGYIQITSFSNDTTELLTKAAKEFKSKNVTGLVLDMRDNPGGLLPQAVNVSSVWLAQGRKILDTKKGSAVVDSNYAVGGNILGGIPTVVLINAGSASASEIVAGALRDNNVAYIIGEKSYGKGVVQELITYGDGSQLKVTVASWYRPNGQNINKKGIKPDKTVKISDDDAKAEKDTQLEAAQAYLQAKQ
jgi:carboxyl-terminal processing protease